MAVILLILVALSFQAIADATQFTFTKIGWKVYAETDPEHFAMFGQVRDQYGLRIVSADKEGHYHLKPDCKYEWKSIDKIDEATLRSYRGVRENYLAEKRGPKESPDSYTWTDSFSSDDKREFSAVRLDSKTVVYSSGYFPKELARVVINGNLIVFVHYDGRVVMKTRICTYTNEEILLGGIQKIDPEWKKSMFSSTGDKPLKKHLKRNPINATPYGNFILDQKFRKPDDPGEMQNLQRRLMNAVPVIDNREIHMGI